MIIEKIAWERLEVLFIAVAPVALDADPLHSAFTISSPDTTGSSNRPAICDIEKIFNMVQFGLGWIQISNVLHALYGIV